MRKTLVQTLLAAFCAIPATAPLEGGGVMLLGARQFFEGGGWKNPYVTDGLVAMWDGEWNAGGGVHDPNATVWKDLSESGNDMTLFGSPSFESQCLYCPTGGTFGTFTPIAYSADNTVEMVARRYFNNQYAMRVIGLNANDRNNLIYTRAAAPVQGYQPAAPSGLAKVQLNMSNTAIHSMSLCFSGSAYMNGVESSIVSNNYWAVRDNGILNGGWDGDRGGDRTRWFTIRVYSRALTAAEVAANYAVDKARFGLT